jgi:hypothetical protein
MKEMILHLKKVKIKANKVKDEYFGQIRIIQRSGIKKLVGQRIKIGYWIPRKQSYEIEFLDTKFKGKKKFIIDREQLLKYTRPEREIEREREIEIEREIKPEREIERETRPEREIEREIKPILKKKSKKSSIIKLSDVANAVKKIIRTVTVSELKNVLVKDGYLKSTDLEVALVKKIDLPDGLYHIIDKTFIESRGTLEEFEEFAEIPIIDMDKAIKIGVFDKDELIRNLTILKKMVSIDFSKIAMTYILLHIKNNKAILVATTGSILGIRDIDVEEGVDGQYLINPITPDILKVLEGDKIEVYKQERKEDYYDIFFKGADGFVVNMVIRKDILYPNYEQVFGEIDKQVIVNKMDFLKALDELEPYAKYIKYPIIKLQIDPESREMILKVEKEDQGTVITVKQISIPAELTKITQKMSIKGNLIMGCVPPWMEEKEYTSQDEAKQNELYFNIDNLYRILDNIDGEYFYICYSFRWKPIQFISEELMKSNPKKKKGGFYEYYNSRKHR